MSFDAQKLKTVKNKNKICLVENLFWTLFIVLREHFPLGSSIYCAVKEALNLAIIFNNF